MTTLPTIPHELHDLLYDNPDKVVKEINAGLLAILKIVHEQRTGNLYDINQGTIIKDYLKGVHKILKTLKNKKQ